MANGAVQHGSTTYTFDINYQWGSARPIAVNEVVTRSTSGKLYVRKRYTYQAFTLIFKNISDTQRAALYAAQAANPVTFYPNGYTTGAESYTGIWTVESDNWKYSDSNDMTVRFESGPV
ncbi:MAG TPA: hypothetical protein VLH56_11360 [Dissulfurispiraceae bacterium]|nr:hypothetical protein [Dissulfurispiraceae bacterium]